jgi:transposase, IS30 family
LITGKLNRSAIGTLVERVSRFTILLHLPARHTAEAVRGTVIAAMFGLPPQLRRSLTWDQGKEMACHRHHGPVADTRQPAPSRPGPSVEQVDAAFFGTGTGSPADVTALTATLRRHPFKALLI